MGQEQSVHQRGECPAVRVPAGIALGVVGVLAVLLGGYLSSRSAVAGTFALVGLVLGRSAPANGLGLVLAAAPFCGRSSGWFDPVVAGTVGTLLGWLLRELRQGEVQQGEVRRAGVLVPRWPALGWAAGLGVVLVASLGSTVVPALVKSGADLQEVFQTSLHVTATDPLYAVYSVFTFWVGVGVAALVAGLGRERERLIMGLAAGHAATLALGFLDHARVIDLRWLRPISSVIAGSGYPHRMVSTFWHPSWYAQWLAMMLPLLLGLAWERSGGRRGAMLALAAVTAVALPVTFQRGGWFAAIAGCALVSGAWLRRAGIAGVRRRGALIGVWVVCVAVGSVGLLAASAQGETVSRRAGEMRDISGRETLWRGALAVIGERPVLGHGHNTFAWIYPQRYTPSRPDFYSQNNSAHNGYLQMAAGAGVLGLALFIGLVGSTLVSALRVMRAGTVADSALAAGAAGALGACLTHGLVQEFFHIPALSLVFWTLTGLIGSTVRSSHASAAQAPARPEARRPPPTAPTQLPDWQEALR